METLVPEELRLLEAVTVDWSRRVVWPELELRVTVTFEGRGLGDRRSLEEQRGASSDHRCSASGSLTNLVQT